jgi:hypothetical protein
VNLSKEDLTRAASEGVITPEQAERLWQKLKDRDASSARSGLDVAMVAYYLGALIVMSAMGWLMTRGWEQFGGLGIFLLATLYAVLFALAGRTLWYKEKLRTPGGLLFTLAVWMTPLAIYGLERVTGVWPQGAPVDFRSYHIWIKGSWILMETGTIVAGLIALKFIRFPFLTFPIAFSLWYMSMDLAPLLVGKSEFTLHEQLWASLCFGLVILLVTYLIDRRTREDYAFWGYLFGLMAFWGGLSMMESSSEWKKFLYCLINLGLILLAVFLQRPVFVVFGACGVFGYLAYLSYDVFKDSFLFPIILSLLGLVVIFLGVQYQKHRQQFEGAVLAMIPASVRQLRPAER